MLVNTVICTLAILTAPNTRIVAKFVGTEQPRVANNDSKLVNFCASFAAAGVKVRDCVKVVNDNFCQYVGPVYSGYEAPGEAPGGGVATGQLSDADFSPGGRKLTVIELETGLLKGK